MTTSDPTQEPTSQQDTLIGLGAFSALGLYICLLILTIFGGMSYLDIFSEVFQLATGNVSLIGSEGETILQTIMTIIVVVVIALPIAIISGALFNEEAKSYDMEAIDAMLDKRPIVVFSVIALEEIVTRGLFLGLLTKLFTGDIGFYAMFLMGNAVWAYVHIYSFKDKGERSILRVIPQFVAGIAFTYVFVKYGLFVAIMAHYLYNTILFAMRKEKMPNQGTALTLGYYLVLFLAIWIMMAMRELSTADLLTWLTEEASPLNGYSFLDYAIVLVGINSIAGITTTALLMDDTNGRREAIDKVSEMRGLNSTIFIAVSAMLRIGLILLLNWLLGFFIEPIVTRSIVITVTLAMLAKSSSGSALTRATIVNLTSSFFTVTAFVVLGFWPAVGLALITFATQYVPLYLSD